MPFVPQEHREEGYTPHTPGDLCYKEYLKLMNTWRANKRWTTVHEEFKRVFEIEDNEKIAKTLAYLTWLIREVMTYEDEKEKENGPI